MTIRTFAKFRMEKDPPSGLGIGFCVDLSNRERQAWISSGLGLPEEANSDRARPQIDPTNRGIDLILDEAFCVAPRLIRNSAAISGLLHAAICLNPLTNPPVPKSIPGHGWPNRKSHRRASSATLKYPARSDEVGFERQHYLRLPAIALLLVSILRSQTSTRKSKVFPIGLDSLAG